MDEDDLIARSRGLGDSNRREESEERRRQDSRGHWHTGTTRATATAASDTRGTARRRPTHLRRRVSDDLCAASARRGRDGSRAAATARGLGAHTSRRVTRRVKVDTLQRGGDGLGSGRGGCLAAVVARRRTKAGAETEEEDEDANDDAEDETKVRLIIIIIIIIVHVSDGAVGSSSSALDAGVKGAVLLGQADRVRATGQGGRASRALHGLFRARNITTVRSHEEPGGQGIAVLLTGRNNVHLKARRHEEEDVALADNVNSRIVDGSTNRGSRRLTLTEQQIERRPTSIHVPLRRGSRVKLEDGKGGRDGNVRDALGRQEMSRCQHEEGVRLRIRGT